MYCSALSTSSSPPASLLSLSLSLSLSISLSPLFLALQLHTPDESATVGFVWRPDKGTSLHAWIGPLCPMCQRAIAHHGCSCLSVGAPPLCGRCKWRRR